MTLESGKPLLKDQMAVKFVTVLSHSIFGMDFFVVMGRPGFRVSRRKHATSRVGFKHRVKKEDTMTWFRSRFDGLLTFTFHAVAVAHI